MRTLDTDAADAMLLAVEHSFGDAEKGEKPFSLEPRRAGRRCTSGERSTESTGCTTGSG